MVHLFINRVHLFNIDPGLTNLLFDMDDVKLDVGKLAMWRINTHQQFGGTWLSDYLANKFEMGEELKSSMEPEL
jgi:hypothetical protein